MPSKLGRIDNWSCSLDLTTSDKSVRRGEWGGELAVVDYIPRFFFFSFLSFPWWKKG